MRRSHNKSHFGCAQCKKRKVKVSWRIFSIGFSLKLRLQCDETTPSCNNCTRRREQCSFLEATSASSIEPATSEPHNQQYLQERSARNILDIDLTHFFLIWTLPTVLFSPTRKEIWYRDIFPSSLSQSTLLEAQLTTAAMHKIAINDPPQSRERYLHYALEMQTNILSDFIAMLSDPSKETATSLFTLSALIVVWCYASRSLPPQLQIISKLPFESSNTGQEYHSGGYLEDMLSIIKISQGISAVLEQCRHWLLDQGMRPIIENEDIEAPPFPEACQPLDSLHDYVQSSIHDPLMQEVYASEIERTKRYLRRATVDSNYEFVVGWPTRVSRAYVNAIAERQTPALVILAYWAASLSPVDNQWWAGGWAKGIVREVQSLVDDSWRVFLEWPLKTLSLDDRKSGVHSTIRN